jgi:hypothetical protein
MMTTGLCDDWLDRYIPVSMDLIEDYQKLIFAAREFERDLQFREWTEKNVLHDWTVKAPELWGHHHTVHILDHVRMILRKGVLPNTSLTASHGAIEYEDIISRSVSDWTWDEDWTSPPSSSTSNQLTRRKTRHSTSQGTKIYECTSIPSQLITLLGSILQEYTHLPNYPLISSCQNTFPELIRSVFIIYRAGGILHAGVDLETPIRLINDCFYIAGEIGLMALGMSHLGFISITNILEETSQDMDICGIHWKTRYLVNFLAHKLT